MNFKALFIEIVRKTEDLPEKLRERAEDFTTLEEHRIDQSYLDFLDEQIKLSPRGPEWTARLKRRRTALQAFCGVVLLRGSMRVGKILFEVEIQPKTKAVIHWEEYDLGPLAKHVAETKANLKAGLDRAAEYRPAMLDSSTMKRFKDALASGELFELAMQMTAEGLSQVEIYDKFASFCEFLGKAHRDADEEALMGCLECIVGYCSPGSKWFDHYLTNEEIYEYGKRNG